jgi:peroxiredoxin/predicted negative regulator of RcsB-dependent stress response
MKTTIFFFVFLLLSSPVSDAIGISAGETAPDFSLTSIDGNILSLSEYKDHVVVLIYWRTGQKRSILAIKDGNDILEKFERKNVKVIGIIADSESQEDAKGVIKENGINYPVVVDSDRQLFSNYGIRVYPTTVIIDKEGKFVHGIPSHPLTYKKVLDGYIRKAIGEIDESELQDVLSPKKEKVDKSSLEALRFYNLALKFTKSGMIDMAINTVNRSIEARPEMAKSHILLGFLYLETKEADKALEAFNKALELEPRSNEAKTGLGGALIMKGDVDKAVEILNTAAVANPYPQMTYYELGKAYELKGEKDKSIEMYKKAIEKIIKKQVLPSLVSKCN